MKCDQLLEIAFYRLFVTSRPKNEHRFDEDPIEDHTDQKEYGVAHGERAIVSLIQPTGQ